MELLKRIPQDGTFNQTRPLDMLLGHREVFPFDFQSATDRWPLSLQSRMLGVLFDEDLANYVENVFAFFPFRSALPFVFVLFNAGQPLGYQEWRERVLIYSIEVRRDEPYLFYSRRCHFLSLIRQKKGIESLKASTRIEQN